MKIIRHKTIYIFFYISMLAAVTLYSLNCQAQFSSAFHYFNISTLTPDDGLSQGSNYFRYEDSHGFMWITTNNAINRYDGTMVKVYRKDSYFKDCVPLKQGYSFAEDSSSNIYIGSTDGLYIYHRNEDRFTVKKIFINAVDGNTVPFAFRNDCVWCYNRQYNIAAYNVITQKITYFSDLKMEPLASLHPYLFLTTSYAYRQPFFDRNGILWIANKTMLASYDLNTGTINYHLSDFFKKNNLALNGCCYSNRGNFALFGTNQGILKYDLSTRQTTLIEQVDHSAFGNVWEVSDYNNNFIGQSGFKGVFILNDSLNHIYYLDQNNIGLNTNDCEDVKPDKSNRIWMCDNGFGFIIIDFSNKMFFKETGDINGKRYFYKRGVNGFAEMENGNILIRSGENLFCQDKKTKNITPLFQDTTITHTFLSSDLPEKGFWYWNGNLIQFYDSSYRSSIVIKVSHDTNGVIQDMAVLPNGNLLTVFSKGLFLVNSSIGKLEPVKEMPPLNAFKINLLSRNHIAVSYLNGDMLLADVMPDSRIIPQQKILPGVHSFYILEDSLQNQYWVATDEGIYQLDSAFKIIKKIDANNDLAGTYIYGLLSDDAGNIWCSHERGLSSINKMNYQVTNYGKDDGIQDWDFNNRSFYKATDGTLYFGGVSGYNYFKPPVSKKSFYSPKVYVDEILTNNHPYISDTNFNLVDKINVPFSASNNISLHVIVKDLERDRNLDIIYRIRNKDSTWKHLPNNNYIVFNSLAPGNYTLEMGTGNNSTKQNLYQKSIAISIIPEFYQTKIFYIVIAALITALLFWLYNRWRLNRQQRIFQQKLALDRERSRITADLHDDIGSSLSSLQVYSTVANQLMDTDKEKTKQMLNKISLQSVKLLDSIGDIIWSMKGEGDQFIGTSSRIKNFVSDVLGATTIEYEIHVDKAIDRIVKNITAKKNIILIVKEAVNNCIKYSKAKQVRISVYEKDQLLHIEIVDDGVGISDFLVKRGNGLSNMKKRTEELKGKFEIISGVQNGTAIICKIPIVGIRDSKA